MESKAESHIQKFYEGRSVFLTGVTGYLGKAILEKLLRSCTGIKKVYVLVRPKHGSTVESRLESLFKSPLFDSIKEKCPENLLKVHAVAGDIEMQELGMSSEWRLEICRNVSVIIHSAASIKFNEPLKVAININYNGTKRVLKLANDCHALAAMIYISTAYSNCDLKEIPEKIITPNMILKEIDQMNEEEIAKITPSIIGNKPNTYTYTKALTESMLQQEGAQLPICIVRPSIIGATWNEPSAGFVDSLTGLTGVMAAIGKGVLTSLNCEKDMVLDVIPLDVVVNLTVASAWRTYIQQTKDILVYHCCSGQLNPTTLAKLRIHILKSCDETPFNGVLRYPRVNLVASSAINAVITFFFTIVPFFLTDFCLSIANKKPKMIKIYKKMDTAMEALHFFVNNQWSFEMENIKEICKDMNEMDRELFYLNIEDMSWNDYISDYAVGIKRWIFKENLAQLPKAKKHMNKMYWIEKCLSMVASVLFGYVVVLPAFAVLL